MISKMGLHYTTPKVKGVEINDDPGYTFFVMSAYRLDTTVPEIIKIRFYSNELFQKPSIYRNRIA